MEPRFFQASALVLPACSALLAVGCSAPSSNPRVTIASPAATPIEPAEMVAELIVAHNRARVKAGLSELVVNPQLEAAAERHARDMAARGRMSHRGGDGSSPFRRMALEGYEFRAAAENVAFGQSSVETLMRDWMRSPGHRRNILGNFTEMGASGAIDKSGNPYWCVTFGQPTQRESATGRQRVGYH